MPAAPEDPRRAVGAGVVRVDKVPAGQSAVQDADAAVSAGQARAVALAPQVLAGARVPVSAAELAHIAVPGADAPSPSPVRLALLPDQPLPARPAAAGALSGLGARTVAATGVPPALAAVLPRAPTSQVLPRVGLARLLLRALAALLPGAVAAPEAPRQAVARLLLLGPKAPGEDGVREVAALPGRAGSGAPFPWARQSQAIGAPLLSLAEPRVGSCPRAEVSACRRALARVSAVLEAKERAHGGPTRAPRAFPTPPPLRAALAMPRAAAPTRSSAGAAREATWETFGRTVDVEVVAVQLDPARAGSRRSA